MDPEINTKLSDSLVVTATGACLLNHSGLHKVDASLNCMDERMEVKPWLKIQKSKKFMGKQDQLALIAAGRCLQKAQLDEALLQQRTGLYLVVGFIPFERREIQSLAENSSVDGQFSMQRFSTDGLDAVNPLLTFRCLPNMPAYHISANFGIQGPYFVTYPDAGQFYLAIEQAKMALLSNEIDVALIGAVADQNNFLVQHHLQRILEPEQLTRSDSAGFICLERENFARDRGANIVFKLTSLRYDYKAPNYLQQIPASTETFYWGPDTQLELERDLKSFGPSSLAISLHLNQHLKSMFSVKHKLVSSSGLSGSSEWNVCDEL
ncbi:hypothetical protein MNBD_GAMMA12-1980 [hydrothermal vent metagenome]|uniref:Beta-ketoacyl synthase-like N-terminal domain-containing protein n=1 Tax=hydrothermal vent metagenome TaxID=652676 RepID=A0A3B0ZN04_9ZZZZ